MQLKKGQRIELVSMGPDPFPIETGAKGTVEHVQPIGGSEVQVQVKWDNGRSLMLILPHDCVRVIED